MGRSTLHAPDLWTAPETTCGPRGLHAAQPAGVDRRRAPSRARAAGPARLARRIAVETQELTRAQRPWRRPRLERARVRAGAGRGGEAVCAARGLAASRGRAAFCFAGRVPRGAAEAAPASRRFCASGDAGVYRVRPHVAKRPPAKPPRGGREGAASHGNRQLWGAAREGTRVGESGSPRGGGGATRRASVCPISSGRQGIGLPWR